MMKKIRIMNLWLANDRKKAGEFERLLEEMINEGWEIKGVVSTEQNAINVLLQENG